MFGQSPVARFGRVRLGWNFASQGDRRILSSHAQNPRVALCGFRPSPWMETAVPRFVVLRIFEKAERAGRCALHSNARCVKGDRLPDRADTGYRHTGIVALQNKFRIH